MPTPQTPLPSSFGARSTAADVIAGRDLRGVNTIVTGGYSGLGLETVRALAGAGAHVTVPVRDEAARLLGTDDPLGYSVATGIPELREAIARHHQRTHRIDVSADMSRHDEERLLQLIENHYAYTGSTVARQMLDNWAMHRTRFVKVMPVEYRRALREMERHRSLQAAE